MGCSIACLVIPELGRLRQEAVSSRQAQAVWKTLSQNETKYKGEDRKGKKSRRGGAGWVQHLAPVWNTLLPCEQSSRSQGQHCASTMTIRQQPRQWFIKYLRRQRWTMCWTGSFLFPLIWKTLSFKILSLRGLLAQGHTIG